MCKYSEGYKYTASVGVAIASGVVSKIYGDSERGQTDSQITPKFKTTLPLRVSAACVRSIAPARIPFSYTHIIALFTAAAHFNKQALISFFKINAQIYLTCDFA